MKPTQNLRISLSDFPLGSKSAPPLPPPMFTTVVSLILENKDSKLTSGQCILEDLLKTKEFQNGQIDTGVESETALVWT